MADLTQMRILILTAELGSLAAVARKLGVSPAAISKQLTRLEEELKVQLLVRTTRKVELTSVGVAYCRQCRQIFEEVDAAAALISQVKAEPSGILKVVSGRHFAASYIVPHMCQFLAKYPSIKVELELAERIPDIHQEAIDVLIGMSISATGDAIQKTIATTSYVFCATPEYIRQHGMPEKPSDLKQHRYITHSMRKPDDCLQFLDYQNVTVEPYLRVNDVQTMLDFALAGLGIVMLHHYVVKTQLETGALCQVLARYGRDQIPIYVAYPQRRYICPKVRCFVDFIDEKVKAYSE